ncbi:MAG TPA: hypothetical protein VN638_05910 [Nitrospiraceae bacterium]|nr:hypothetical protein [Nitrospiraceae bacterium]
MTTTLLPTAEKRAATQDAAEDHRWGMFVAPRYEALTTAFHDWLLTHKDRWSVRAFYLGPDASPEKVGAEVRDRHESVLYCLFMGHGADAAWLTFPEGEFDREKRNHRTLMSDGACTDDKVINAVGFCCNAATVLGARIRRRGQYIGFRRRITVPLRENEIGTFLKPLAHLLDALEGDSTRWVDGNSILCQNLRDMAADIERNSGMSRDERDFLVAVLVTAAEALDLRERGQ